MQHKKYKIAIFAFVMLLSMGGGATQSYAAGNSGITNNYIKSLTKMAEQLSAVAMHQMTIIGAFFDSENQLEAQRDIQIRTAEAHKDYHPSEQMCRFGTFMRSVARTEEKASFDRAAMNTYFMDAQMGKAATSITAKGYGADIDARLMQFRKTYCDPLDNKNGLNYMCDHDQGTGDAESSDSSSVADGEGVMGAENPNRMNKDIDFARTLGSPLTLDIDFSDGEDEISEGEEDIIALGRNLYFPRALEPIESKTVGLYGEKYLDRRALLATNAIAHNSFANIASLKSSAAKEAGENGAGENSGWVYMKALLRNFGMDDTEIHAMLGDFPSYYAQMEVLTKKIYQDPDFYTELYDKPTNVKRVGVSMKAIQLMQARDHLQSAQRQEMLTSLRLEQALRKHYNLIEPRLQKTGHGL